MRLGAFFILLCTTAAPLPGQALEQVCRPLENPAVGGWATYRLFTPGGDSAQVRLAVVARVRGPEGDRVWQESTVGTAGTETVIQSLVPADPYDPTAIQRAILWAPGQEPMELPGHVLTMMRQDPGRNAGGLDACRGGDPEEWETQQVPAGRVRALRVRYTRDGREAVSWLAPGIPFALVRTVVTGANPDDRFELVLVGHGLDAQPTRPVDSVPRR